MSDAKGKNSTSREHRLQLPPAPSGEDAPVKAWIEPVVMLTYLPAAPDSESYVFRGARLSGKQRGRLPTAVYRSHCHRAETPQMEGGPHREQFLRRPDSAGDRRPNPCRIRINQWLRLYLNQDVIKRRSVGLAGPWISGGVEFNWPQHHRPATFLPVDIEIEGRPMARKQSGAAIMIPRADEGDARRLPASGPP